MSEKYEKPKSPEIGGLMLSRKEKERIIIFDPVDGAAPSIVIELVKLSGNRAAIRILADQNRFKIVRGELIGVDKDFPADSLKQIVHRVIGGAA